MKSGADMRPEAPKGCSGYFKPLDKTTFTSTALGAAAEGYLIWNDAALARQVTSLETSQIRLILGRNFPQLQYKLPFPNSDVELSVLDGIEHLAKLGWTRHDIAKWLDHKGL